MRTVISYETIGELGRLPSEILGLIFAQLSPIQQFKITMDPLLCIIFNQAGDYTIPADISDIDLLILFTLRALTDTLDMIDINRAPNCYKSYILDISANHKILDIYNIIHIIFDNNNVSEFPLDRTKPTDLYDLDTLYSYLYPIVEKKIQTENESTSGDYFNIQMIYDILVDNACNKYPQLFVKYFVDRDISDKVYQQIIDSISIFIQEQVTQCKDFDDLRMWQSKFRNIESPHHIYIVKPWDTLALYSDADVIVPILERVFTDPRLEKYRIQWINEIMFKSRELDIKVYEAIYDSPLLSYHIKWVYVNKGGHMEIMYTNPH